MEIFIRTLSPNKSLLRRKPMSPTAAMSMSRTLLDLWALHLVPTTYSLYDHAVHPRESVRFGLEGAH
eukprot:5716437-Amphidinium_carterae.1